MHAALALATVGLTLATGPTAVWRQSGIGAGRIASAQMFASPNQFRQRCGIVQKLDGCEVTLQQQAGRLEDVFLVVHDQNACGALVTGGAHVSEFEQVSGQLSTRERRASFSADVTDCF